MTSANHKPLRRKVEGGRLGTLVVALTHDTLTIRPYRARNPLFEATYSEIVHAVLWCRTPRRRRGRKATP